MLYLNDEGSTLQRILSAFSIRPTVCATTPYYNTVNNVAMHVGQIVPKVSTCPMITVKIQPNNTLNNNRTKYNLQDAISMPQWYVEDGNIVLKNQQIIYSRGLIIFYVPRRAHTLNIANIQNPYHLTRLPATVANFERLNDRQVDFPYDLQINNSSYRLRSVVCLEVSRDINVNGPNIITGQSCCITRYPENSNHRHYWYNPKAANIGYINPKLKNQDGVKYSKNKPFTILDQDYSDPRINRESHYFKCSRRGTIFVYEQKNDGGLTDKLYF